jgi:Zn-dependent metalloprotease
MSNIIRTQGFIPDQMLLRVGRMTGDPSYAGTIYKQSLLTARTANNSIRYRVAAGKADRMIYDCRNTERLPGFKVRFEGDPAVSDQVVNECYKVLGQNRDFLKAVLGINGLDDKGSNFIGSVHYGQAFENAFSNGRQMVLGDGGKIFKTFVIIVIVGHENFHTRISLHCDLEYQDESGALNESGADAAGCTNDMWVLKVKSADYHWLVGKGALDPSINGEALRNMLHPGTAFNDKVLGKDGQPDHYSKYVHTYSDNGGVHTNSGIPNRAYALYCINAGGYAFEGPFQVWDQIYNGNDHISSTASFQDFADHSMVIASRDLPKSVDGLRKAWDTVGITVK